jgi:hypothetical protein
MKKNLCRVARKNNISTFKLLKNPNQNEKYTNPN